MAFKTGVLIVILAIVMIFEVQSASIASEKDMWNNLDTGLLFHFVSFVVQFFVTVTLNKLPGLVGFNLKSTDS